MKTFLSMLMLAATLSLSLSATDALARRGADDPAGHARHGAGEHPAGHR